MVLDRHNFSSIQANSEFETVSAMRQVSHLYRIHRAARHVLDDNVGSKRLGREKLEQLKASVLRQASEAKALQERLAEVGADEAQRAEVADLVAYFDATLAAIARQLSA